MKEIKLNRGLFALVDDEDYDFLNQFKWYARKDKVTHYVERNKTNKDVGRELKMSRLIMGALINEEVDHADSNGLNNQRYNLRKCNRSQNCANRKRWGKNKYRGVYILKKYITSYITVNNNQIYLGTFKTEIQAAKAYDEAAKKYFGEFANLNF